MFKHATNFRSLKNLYPCRTVLLYKLSITKPFYHSPAVMNYPSGLSLALTNTWNLTRFPKRNVFEVFEVSSGQT